MIDGPKTPDFSTMEISSVRARKVIDRSFLVICVIISFISLVILAILVSSIIIKAIPVFGPHADRFESQNRMRLVQGNNEGNDPDSLDVGDIVQGIFVVDQFERGGLGNRNDIPYDKQERLLGVYSLEVTEFNDSNLFKLRPATGDQNVLTLIDSLGVSSDQPAPQPKNATNAAMVLLENSDAPDLDIAKLKITEQLSDAFPELPGWKANLTASLKAKTYATLDLSPVIDRETQKTTNALKAIQKVRVKKRGGYLSGLFSIQQQGLAEGQFKPVKLRNKFTEELEKGDLKITDTDLLGLSRRKKNGFDFGGKINLVFCPTPEDDASMLGHAAQFTWETNKTDPDKAGIGPALMGTLWVCLGCALFALPLGIGTAILLEEFKPTNKIIRFFHRLVQINITNLAGVPSIVYGILGLTAFASMFGYLGTSKNPFFEVGTKHYFQYLTENDRPVLIPIASDRQKTGRKIENIAKKIRAKVLGSDVSIRENGETVYEIDNADLSSWVASLPADVDEIFASVEGLKTEFASANVDEAYERVVKRKAQLLEVLATGGTSSEDITSETKSMAIALTDLGEEVRKPDLHDEIAALSTDGKPLKLNIIDEDDEYPTDEEVLNVSLRADSSGGPISKPRWYYFRLPFGRSVLAASLTLMLVILPVIIIASQEALRAVPPSLRECALGLGATPWQVIRKVTLPAAVPSIMTGAILSMSRAIGEAAPVLIICGILYVTAGPSNLMDFFSILPIQIFNTTKLPENEELLINTQNVAAAGIIILLVILLTFNGIAIAIRQWFQKPLS